jgi:hypothetical protein
MMILLFFLTMYQAMLVTKSSYFLDINSNFKRNRNELYSSTYKGIYSLVRGLIFFSLLIYSVVGIICILPFYKFAIILFLSEVIKASYPNKYTFIILNTFGLLTYLYIFISL